MNTVPFTFQEAAARQHLYGSFYTVWMVAPDGSKVYLGMTPRKTGTGLMAVLRRETVQALVATLPGAAEATFKKSAEALTLSNGYAVRFGGTIRQEASEAGR